MFSSDKPIFEKEDDFLYRTKFSINLAKAMLSYQNTDSLVIGLYGKWGSGKSSVSNLIIEELKNNEYDDYDKIPIIINFNPWNFSDQNQLLSQLFNSLAQAMEYESFDETRKKSAKILRSAEKIAKVAGHLPVVSEVSKLVYPLLKDYADFLSPDDKKALDLQKTKKEIIKHLKKIKCKVLIFIDDIDRLNRTEIRQIFQAVKSLGDFPNTIYFLMFDKDVVIESLSGVQAGNGEDYLNKIVQIPITLPEPNHYEVLNTLTARLYVLTAGCPEYRQDLKYDLVVFDKCVKPFIKNIRDINRLMNTFEFKYYLIKNEVNISDLLAITAFEIFIPEVHKWIGNNRALLLGESLKIQRNDENNLSKEDFIGRITTLCGEYTPETILDGLCELFPNIKRRIMRKSELLNDSYSNLLLKQRLASPKKFEYYFSLSLKEDEMPYEEIENFMWCEPLDALVSMLNREDHSPQAFLEVLNVNTATIPQERIGILLDAILYSYPSIYEQKCNIFTSNVLLYAIWITRDLLLRLELDKRLKFFSLNLSDYPKLSIFLFIRLLEDEERFYGRWHPLYKDSRYEVLFEESQLEEVEKKVLLMILSIVSEKFIFDLDDSGFWHFIFAWEILDYHNPQIIKMMKPFLSDDNKLIRIINQKVYLESSQNVWEIDVDGLQKYISLDSAYSCIKKLKNTPSLNNMTASFRNGLIAFAVYYEEHSEANSNIIGVDLVQNKLSEWGIKEQK